MIAQLFAATVLVLMTVSVHGIGLMWLTRALSLEEREEAAIGIHNWRTFFFTLLVVLALFLLHGIEIWIYAFASMVAHAMPDLFSALYFSTITYATIGYDAEGLTRDWQLVAAIEGINGVILMGWSTAFFVRVIGRLSSDRK